MSAVIHKQDMTNWSKVSNCWKRVYKICI